MCGAEPVRLRAVSLVNKEDCVEHNGFGQSHAEHGQHNDLAESAGIASTASEAFMPTNPTPMAEPRPARPT